jgi:hypothetical protein
MGEELAGNPRPGRANPVASSPGPRVNWTLQALLRRLAWLEHLLLLSDLQQQVFPRKRSSCCCLRSPPKPEGAGGGRPISQGAALGVMQGSTAEELPVPRGACRSFQSGEMLRPGPRQRPLQLTSGSFDGLLRIASHFRLLSDFWLNADHPRPLRSKTPKGCQPLRQLGVGHMRPEWFITAIARASF